MKALLIYSLGGLLLAGCTMTESERVSRSEDETSVYGMSDQPQTSVAGEGSLMPGAYESGNMETGQFTGQERTNSQIGQRATLPPETDVGRGPETETGKGAGTLGQSGIVPGEPVTSETLLEDAERLPE